MKLSDYTKVLVCALLAAGTLTSCGGDAPATETTADSGAAATTAPEEDLGYPAPEIEAVDCGGKEFTAAIYDEKVDTRLPYREIRDGTQTGEVLDDAIYTRDMALSEKYNIKLETRTFSTPGDLENGIKQEVLAGDSDIDIISCRIWSCEALAMNGCLMPFQNLSHIDMEAPWWVGESIRATSIEGVNYFGAGYANTVYFEAAGAVYFNKQMVETFNLTSPYELVNSGKWTWDTFTAMCRQVGSDLDGNNVYDRNDRYGFATNNSTWMHFFAGTGNQIAGKDKNDLPILTSSTQKAVTQLEKIIAFDNDKTTTLLAETFTGYPAAGDDRMMIPMTSFIEEKALFTADVIANIRLLRNLEADFGVLPPPKYDENQESYISYVHPNIATAMCVPITTSDADLTGRILEDMMFESYKTVRPALFEIALNEKYSRDSESAKSFEHILNGALLDIGYCLRLALDNDVRVMIFENKNNIVSTMEANAGANQKLLEDAIKAYADYSK